MATPDDVTKGVVLAAVVGVVLLLRELLPFLLRVFKSRNGKGNGSVNRRDFDRLEKQMDRIEEKVNKLIARR